MKYKLAIFDLDGTILNTLEDLADSCNYILKKNGFPTHSKDKIKYMVGNGIPKLIQRALQLDSNTKGTESDVESDVYTKVLTEFMSWYQNHCSIKTAPYPGITECMHKLRENGVKIAVNTNKAQEAAEILCKQYFPNLIDIVFGGRKDVPVKPAINGVMEILKLEKKSPDECVFIGDSDVDIETGKNAKMDTISVDWGFRGAEFLKEHGAEKIVYSAHELEKIILD